VDRRGEGPQRLFDLLHNEAAIAFDDAIVWRADSEWGPELFRLLKMLRRWRTEILSYHRTGASNGPVQAATIWRGDGCVFDVADDVDGVRRGRALLSVSPMFMTC
jgi:hypothetical protein